MGMYTDLTVKVKLKEEFIPVIKNLMSKNHSDDNLSYWYGLGYDFLDEYSQYSRADFIPFGGTLYDKERKLTDDGIWWFTCSLKNYDHTIEYFLENVLSRIIEESYEISYEYEEWYSPRYYQFIDGKLEIIETESTEWEYETGFYLETTNDNIN